MTTFEITIIILVVLGMLMMGWLVKVSKNVFEALQVANIQIRDIKTYIKHLVNLGFSLPKLVDISNQQQNAWACDITTIIKLLKEIENCLTQDINWGELTDSQQSEILYRLTHPVVENPFKPPFNPTCETTNKED